jgi:hypothetical protein
MKGVQVDTILYGPFTDVVLYADRLECMENGRVDTILFFDVIGEEYEILDNPDFPQVEVAEAVPPIVTMAQARKALILGGVSIASVDGVINNIADITQRELAFTDWQYSTTVLRASPLVLSLAPLLGLTEEEIDQLFILAASL